jgi:hypothetical protein
MVLAASRGVTMAKDKHDTQTIDMLKLKPTMDERGTLTNSEVVASAVGK